MISFSVLTFGIYRAVYLNKMQFHTPISVGEMRLYLGARHENELSLFIMQTGGSQHSVRLIVWLAPHS